MLLFYGITVSRQIDGYEVELKPGSAVYKLQR